MVAASIWTDVPAFDCSPEDLATIHQVIEELKSGYGGTLVTAPHHKAIDSATFLAHFLRAFRKPKATTVKGLSEYDYLFERILDRVARYPEMLADPRLDSEIFKALEMYELFYHGKHFYRKGDTIYSLHSAKDLLWLYLCVNASAIVADKLRLEQWVEHLVQGMKGSQASPLRCWYLLRLISCTDKTTPKGERIKVVNVTDEITSEMVQPTPFDPFLVVQSDKELPPAFSDGVRQIARSQKLAVECWEIDPLRMPVPKTWVVSLATHACSFYPAKVFGQESWSKKYQDFQVDFGASSDSCRFPCGVNLPVQQSRDGVFFFTYQSKLFVWPNTRMNDAVLKMLVRGQLLSETAYQSLLQKGFQPLSVTLTDQENQSPAHFSFDPTP